MGGQFHEIPHAKEPVRSHDYSLAVSALVEIKDGEEFDVKMQYPFLGMKYGYSRCLVRREVLEKLREARKNLPDGLKLRIWDAWRPFALQEELFYAYSEKIIREFGLSSLSKEEQDKYISQFVSLPVDDRENPPLHTTGGSVDVTLTDRMGRELPMGTEFDAFVKETKTDYFEKEPDSVIKENRRILYHTMVRAGFTNLPSEWWHYDFGNQFWSYYTGRPVMYKGLFTVEEAEGYVEGRSEEKRRGGVIKGGIKRTEA